MGKAAHLERTPTGWRDLVLVCGKCGDKLDGGFGRKGKQPLDKELRHALRAAGARTAARVVETRCLGLCPKRSVSVVLASRPQTILAVPRGAAAADLLASLGLLELPGQLARHDPADQRAGGSRRDDEQQADVGALTDQRQAEAEQQPAGDAAGDAGRDAEHQEFAASDHVSGPTDVRTV